MDGTGLDRTKWTSVAQMAQVNIHEAKTHFSRLVERAEQGEEITIARAGKPVAMLGPTPTATKPPRQFGRLKGSIWIADDFDETPEWLVDAFEGKSDDEVDT